MKKNIIYIVVALAVIAVVIIKLKTNKETTIDRVYRYDKDQPIPVQVDTLAMEQIGNNLFYTGTFEPNKETKISADIQGKINSVLVDAGSVVSKGQSLVLFALILQSSMKATFPSNNTEAKN